ncbi:hypothetical protein BCV72DRAFT_254655 [Rhizopus microsporus var. microsporus]|uniref:Uncharacterized protein n=1 Tax=Rhizopus microsporus var. microsporus TaxID=86635 RepID=A0A1X0RCQ4_RHIZD|nr:hypothetical protein BCV72DRAFT_254655 [Rhizopus microsporus var. microsporus]
MTHGLRGRKPTVSAISNEQIQNLHKQFEIKRRRLVCTNCQASGSFNRNGTTAGDPPQPSFLCKSCNLYCNVHTMANMFQSVSTATDLPFDSSVQESMEISGSQFTSSDINALPSGVTITDLQLTIKKLYAELKQTQAELKQAREEIQVLRNQLSIPPLPSASQSLPLWRGPARLSLLKASMLEQRQQRRLQRQEIAAQFLQPPSENQGFQYIHINNSRILDIHYPARTTVTLLVHNNYAPKLKSHLQKFKVRIIDNFDPCDGSILMDPKYDQCSKEECDHLSLKFRCESVRRALPYICAPVKAAVARYFYTQKWIDKMNHPADIFEGDDSVVMHLLNNEDNHSQL